MKGKRKMVKDEREDEGTEGKERDHVRQRGGEDAGMLIGTSQAGYRSDRHTPPQHHYSNVENDISLFERPRSEREDGGMLTAT